ncbi:helix-turn-helix domain-containing protein [Methanobrevibacter olleyae]|uniref:Transposase n=1 Tax=Methanobrevibacter olleyae TaxID=294671 RepID=A0A126R257_METOL|nr:helix-turn-helix domain-containing protein [Methanobrevibacter olleyae]AMK16152.1 transposase [Methanobrevibacter olleyae]SFL31901.1 Transposase [Methanobrevibacter olleyae]
MGAYDYKKIIAKESSDVYLNETLFMDIFRSIRWADGVYCPKCKSFDVYKKGFLKKSDYKGKIRKYTCKKCNNNFNDFTNTFLENSKVPISIIEFILFHMDTMSVTDMANHVGCSRNTVYRIIKNIYKAIGNKHENLVLTNNGYLSEFKVDSKNRGV